MIVTADRILADIEASGGEGDETQFELEPLENLAKDGQLMAYQYSGFWQCMDTLRDKKLLERLWDSGDAPWQIWD